MTAPIPANADERRDALRILSEPGRFTDVFEADYLARFVLPHTSRGDRWATVDSLWRLRTRIKDLGCDQAEPLIIPLPGETPDRTATREAAILTGNLTAVIEAVVEAEQQAAERAELDHRYPAARLDWIASAEIPEPRKEIGA